jgi:1,4-alpha-glucan branching enzyme
MHSLLGIAQPGLDLCHRQHNGAVDAARALHQGFLYENYPYQRHDAGERADLHSFVVGLQNHDTVGNHPQGRRLKQLASPEFQAAAAVLYLLYPAIPMLFMGEEFACENPFLFFVEFGDPRVREAVEKGRASEFPEMLKMSGVSPLDPEAFTRSKIGPREDGDMNMWQWYQSIIALRKRFRQTGLIDGERMSVDADPETGLFRLGYQSEDEVLHVIVRLGQPEVESESVKINFAGEVLLAAGKNGVSFDGSLRPNEAVVLLSKG